MPLEKLIGKLKTMFHHRESRVCVKKFENRTWGKDESFHEYVHEKTIMGNRVPIDQGELIEYVMDGIPDAALRDQARIQRFMTIDSLLSAFEKVTLRDRGVPSQNRWDGRSGGAVRSERRCDGPVKNGDRRNDKRCFNCGAREHVSANCPTKELGALSVSNAVDMDTSP